MLYHFFQGYTDAIYVAVHHRVPTRAQSALFPEPRVPIEAQVATCCERLFGGAAWLIGTTLRLLRLLGRCIARTRGLAAAAGLAAILAVIPGNAGATLLTFDQARNATGVDVIPIQAGAAVPQDYGDRVTGSPMAVSGGEYTYGGGAEGFTPNVMVDYIAGNGMFLWTIDYGDLLNVMYAAAGSNAMFVRLTADPGFDVVLYAFDLAGWPLTDYTIDAVTVTDGGTTLFSQNDVAVEGDTTGPGHTAFDFITPLVGAELLIGIDFTSIPSGQQDNFGIDNIRFGQNPPPEVTVTRLPEPSSMALLGAGLALLGCIRRRTAP